MLVCLPSTYTHDLQHSILPLDNILFEKDDGTFKVPAKDHTCTKDEFNGFCNI